MKHRISKLYPIAITLASMVLAVASCGKHSGGGKPADVDYYTCTMHPSVKSQDPKAKCPICSMELVPVLKRQGVEASHADHAANAPRSDETNALTEFTVPTERQQQIGVTYAAIEKRPLATTIRAV